MRHDRNAHLSRTGTRADTVLIADDDTNTLRALETLLSMHGYGVVTAGNGIEALRTARAVEPRILVSDCMMPFMDGATLVQSMRADATLARIPVVLMSAVPIPPDVRVSGFLRKPFAVAQLFALLRALLPA